MKDGKYKILAVNPGSTSTKVALFEGEEKVFSASVSHDAETLAGFPRLVDQLDYRKSMIDAMLQEGGVDLSGLDATSGRSGSMMPLPSGTYSCTPLLYEHVRTSYNGVIHPATLGLQIAKQYADEYDCRAFTVNPPEVDEFQPVARITGVKGISRGSHLHALNLKETAIRHARKLGKSYSDCNFIVCHIGGGISVTAHRKGKMIDGNDIVFGLGPMAPTRCGTIPMSEIVEICFSGISKSEAKLCCTKTGGLVSLLGTSDAREVSERAKSGDEEALTAWEGLLYQLVKCIGSMAAVLEGQVDAIVLSGGMVYNPELVKTIEESCSFIAPVSAYPGEFEMEALAMGALRVLKGEEEAKDYDAYVNDTYPGMFL